jgi:hypothetical protein
VPYDAEILVDWKGVVAATAKAKDQRDLAKVESEMALKTRATRRNRDATLSRQDAQGHG